MEQFAYEVHRPAIKKFPRRVVKVFEVDQTWACDLLDMSEFQDQNKGFNFILVTVDVFTRYARVVPLKGKSAEVVTAAFQQLFKERTPWYLWTDNGKEFENKTLHALLKKEGIELYHTYAESKSVIAERFNKTLKKAIYIRMTATENVKWTTWLSELVDKYNHTKSSAIGMTPAEAQTGDHNVELLERQQNRQDKLPENKAPKFKVGDRVRISRVKGTFERGFHANWTSEVFVVAEVLDTRPRMYRLKDQVGTLLEGSFYEPEMQLTKQTAYIIEKVLKERTKDKVKQYYVKWLNLPAKYNSWVDAKEFK